MPSKLIRLLIFTACFMISFIEMNAQQNLATMLLGDLYGKTRQEVYAYLTSFPIKDSEGKIIHSIFSPLQEESTKAHDTVSIFEYFHLDSNQADGISIYFYKGKSYKVEVSGGISISNELIGLLGKGKTKKSKVSAYGGYDIITSYEWNTSDYVVQYAEGFNVPTTFEVVYKPLSKDVQNPKLKIYMEDGETRSKPYFVEWGDSNNVTNHCSSIHRLELVGNVKNLTFVIQCLNGNEVYRKDIPQSKGKKVILTYKDLPKDCEPINIGQEWGMDPENLTSDRYILKLLEGEYEHFSGSLYLNDCHE
jgi:hypothetical protein